MVISKKWLYLFNVGILFFTHCTEAFSRQMEMIQPMATDLNNSYQEIKQAKLQKNDYNGKLISLNFQNIALRAVLQLIADFTDMNMVVSEQVKGTITLRLTNTPWDQALDLILQTNALDKRQTGNIMLIAPASELLNYEKSIFAAQVERKDRAPLRSELVQITYAQANDIAHLLKDKDAALLSLRGTLKVDKRTNALWIQDTPSALEQMKSFIKKVDIPVKQVLIEARIVNISKDFSEDLGVRLGISRPSASASLINPLSDRLNIDLAATALGASPASIGIALAKLGDNILLDLELSALESEGKAEIIASPRLMTTNQQAAVIESGEEIPYQESTSSGATAVAFKKAVLSLKVIPQITADNKLMLDLRINQDTPSARDVHGVPAILTKEIQTRVMVNDGQTIVLGGIYKQGRTRTTVEVPFLGKLPIVGNFFRNKRTSFENEELLIFITPRIITSTSSMTTMEGPIYKQAAPCLRNIAIN